MRSVLRASRASSRAVARARATRGSVLVVFGVLALGGIVVACGASAVTPTPTPAPVTVTPTATPDRHIVGPTDANAVFQILANAGLPVTQESIGAPGPKGEPRLTLYIVAGAYPIAIGQFSSAKALAAAGYQPGSAVAKGDAPFEIWASNVALHIGDQSAGHMPGDPEQGLTTMAQRVVNALDPYLGPLNQRAVQPVTLPTQPFVASPSPVAPASVAPSAKPTAKPKPKPTPKPTKKP